MTNPAMPDLLKVGMTSRVPELRARDEDLNTTGVPAKYEVQYYAFFDDMYLAERKAHQKLKQYHYNKEFFKVDVPTAIDLIESLKLKFIKIFTGPKFEREFLLKAQEKERQRAALSRKKAEQQAEHQRRVEVMKERDHRIENQINKFRRTGIVEHTQEKLFGHLY